MVKSKTAVIDSIEIPVEGERNLLELIRKAHIELPTFCYHSDISVYGACRMCMVEVEGRGLVPACSTPADDGMIVHTNTKQIRDMRKMIIELLLANHDQNCTTCPKSGDCQLQKIARQLGVTKVRFKQTQTFPQDRTFHRPTPSSGIPKSASCAATACGCAARSSPSAFWTSPAAGPGPS